MSTLRAVWAGMMQDLREQSAYVKGKYEAWALKEVDILLAIQRHRDTFPPLRVLRLVLSWHPLKDISLLIWLAFIVTLPWLGYPLCFEFMSIAVVTFGVNWVLGIRVPYKLNHRLKCLSHISPYAFPSMEVAMSAVIATAMARAYGEAWAWTAGYGAVLLICATRLYAGSFLPSHIVLSWIWGALGMVAFRALTDKLFPRRVPDHWKLASAVVFFSQLLGWTALRIERNASPFFRIPKSEYQRVLTHIMHQDEQDEMLDDDEDLLQVASVSSAASRSGVSDSDAEFRGARRRRNKVDSFGYLMRSMERTARRRPEDEGSLLTGM